MPEVAALFIAAPCLLQEPAYPIVQLTIGYQLDLVLIILVLSKGSGYPLVMPQV